MNSRLILGTSSLARVALAAGWLALGTQLAFALSSHPNLQQLSISSISFNYGPRRGGSTVTILGAGFAGTPTVTFGTVRSPSVTFLTGNKLQVLTPMAAQAGTVDVIVANPTGGSVTLTSGFRYVEGPVIYSVSPSSGSTLGGTEVVIVGDILYKASTVSFAGVRATIKSGGTTSMKVITPPHAVALVTVAAQSSTGQTFTLNNAFSYAMGVMPTSLPDGIPGILYNQVLTAKGGQPPFHWSISAGHLPAGLSLDPSSGTISGDPGSTYSTFPFTVQVTDSSSVPFSSAQDLSIRVDIGLKPGSIPADLFGMSTINPSNWPTAPFGVFGKGGNVTWPYIETAKGQFDWSRLDSYLAQVQSRHLGFYWTNYGVPPWAASDRSTCSVSPNEIHGACTSTVANIQDWVDFVTALVTRYKGRIEMYELWNEPDEHTYTGTVQDMIALTQHMHTIVRAIDPAALIGSPSAISWHYLDTYFSLGGTTDVDVVTIHGYPNVHTNDVPEAIAAFKTLPVKSLMLKYGLDHKLLWDTESSWGGSPSVTDSDFRAAFLARDYLLHWSVGVTRFYWYAWDEPVWGTLWLEGAPPLKATKAYEQVYNWMAGATLPQPCSTNGGTTYTAVYTCDLTRSGGYQARAVWDTTQTCASGVCTTSNYTPDPMFVRYRDLDGNVTSISPGKTVRIGAKPILLEN